MSPFVCALPLIGGLFGACAGDAPLAVGYVEGEYVHLAPVTSAELTEVAVRAGDRVAAGQLVARQESTDAAIALAEAEAARGQAEAELANLREGSRPEEIAVIEASLDSARVRLREAEREAERQTQLSQRGIVADSVLDHAVAERDVAATAVAELEAQLGVARLPAREGLLRAAESRLRGAEAAERQAAWRLEKRTIDAPVAGEVADVFRRVGELAGPSAPVVSILPEAGYKLVAFLGEASLAGLDLGERLAVRCDGCPEGLTATISFISDGPEFTPPVIYSVENRQKLVYRIEARLDPEARLLRPGQIVDVSTAAP
ncbi:MAG: HlyD family efflux transporter periplasmic adaptor subunit [Rhodobacteraceae bacterium]|nr:HlyD family efflux transporter periplasmic adaptor subunit [Paracoccaceae bacterium]